jgi:hypothetical protein
MSFTATIEIYQSDGTTLIESFAEVINVQAPEELVFKDTLTFTIEAMGGMGSCSSTLFKDALTISAVVGNIVKIKEDTTVVYVGKINAMPKNQSDINPYSDRVNVVCENILNFDTRKLFYSLTEPSGAPVSTNIQDIYTDIFEGGKYTGKGQENNVTIEDNSIITYLEANNTLPALSIDSYDDGTPVISKIREVINLARGTQDLTAAEPYIYYLKADNSFHTKQRENDTSPLATLDIGSGDFRLYDSADLDGYRTTEDTTGIVNKIVLNGVDITDTSSAGASQYKTQIAASQTTYGIREYRIKQDKVNINKITEWLDGFILRLLNPITKYFLVLNTKTYGHNPIWFMGGANVPDGYIKITKDAGGSTIATVPFQRCTYRLTSGGWQQLIECGEDRPIISLTNLAQPTDAVELLPTMAIEASEPVTSTEQINAPVTFEISSPEGWTVRILNLNRNLLSADPVLTYNGTSKTVTWDADEGVYYSETLARPDRGEMWTVKVVATNHFSQDMISFAYVKGIYRDGAGTLVTIQDPGDPPSGLGPRFVLPTTSSPPEYTTGIEFVVHYNNRDFYKTVAADVDFKIYNLDGSGYYSLVKTLTSATSPTVYETDTSSGIFKIKSFVGGSGTNGWIALSAGVYFVTSEITERWNYIDENGISQSGSETIESEKSPFQIVSKTNKEDRDEIKDRLTTNEADITTNETSIITNSNRLDDQEGLLSDNSGNALIQWNDPDWQVSYNGGTSWSTIAADPSGVSHETFTLNNDNTATQYIYLKFDTSDGTKKGIIRFDRDTAKFEISVNNGSSYTDIATGVTNAIEDTYSANLYQLKVNSSDGSLTFIEDPAGTPVTLFKINEIGSMVVYGDLEPDTDDSHDLGDSGKRFTNAYVSNAVYTEDIIGTDDGTTERWKIGWDGTEQIAFPENIAIGFMDG